MLKTKTTNFNSDPSVLGLLTFADLFGFTEDVQRSEVNSFRRSLVESTRDLKYSKILYSRDQKSPKTEVTGDQM